MGRPRPVLLPEGDPGRRRGTLQGGRIERPNPRRRREFCYADARKTAAPVPLGKANGDECAWEALQVTPVRSRESRGAHGLLIANLEVGVTHRCNAFAAAKHASEKLEHKPKRAPSKHHDDANDGRHDRSDRQKSFRSEISENKSGIRHGSGLPRIKMRRRKNDREGSFEVTTPDVCTTRVEVSRVLRAGYNRWNGKGRIGRNGSSPPCVAHDHVLSDSRRTTIIPKSSGNFVVIGEIEIVVQSKHAIGP
jgi:hypothetical protein